MNIRTPCFTRWLLAAVVLPLLAGACATSTTATTSTTSQATVFIVVRHAEKASDDPRDPSLNAAGQARARTLAASFAGKPLAAVYATAYRRTQMTALPAAQAHGLKVTSYDAKQAPMDFAAQLRQTHPGGTVLIVGHSNTAPAIAAALCGCTVSPLGEDEFDRHMTIRIDPTGAATLAVARY